MAAQLLPEAQGKRETEDLDAREVDVGTVGVGREREPVAFLQEAGAAGHAVVAPADAESEAEVGVVAQVLAEAEEVSKNLVRGAHVDVHGVRRAGCGNKTEAQAAHGAEGAVLLAPLAIAAVAFGSERQVEVETCAPLAGDDVGTGAEILGVVEAEAVVAGLAADGDVQAAVGFEHGNSVGKFDVRDSVLGDGGSGKGCGGEEHEEGHPFFHNGVEFYFWNICLSWSGVALPSR